jgi:uncharacterized Tic20 family protein
VVVSIRKSNRPDNEMKKQAKTRINFTILVVLNCWRVVVVVVASMFIDWSIATATYLMMY